MSIITAVRSATVSFYFDLQTRARMDKNIIYEVHTFLHKS